MHPGTARFLIVLLVAALVYRSLGKGRERVRFAFFTTVAAGAVLFMHMRDVLSLAPAGHDLWLKLAAVLGSVGLVLVFWLLGKRVRGETPALEPLGYPLILVFTAAALLTLAEGVFLGFWGVLGAVLMAALMSDLIPSPEGEERRKTVVQRLFYAALFGLVGLTGLWFAHMIPFSPALGGVFTALLLCTVRDIVRRERGFLPVGRRGRPEKELKFILREVSIFTFGLVALLALAAW